MIHLFKEKEANRPVWILFHGTGGDENDLLPLAEMFDDSMSILSLRGNVKEGTMNRFFKRLAMGVFDEEDLARQTRNLIEFLQEASLKYKFDLANSVVLGYSNGANIAANAMLQQSSWVKAAVLMHPMVPTHHFDSSLSTTRVLITAGENDPICPGEQSIQLKDYFESKQMPIDLKWYRFGHQISSDEVQDISDWLKKTGLI